MRRELKEKVVYHWQKLESDWLRDYMVSLSLIAQFGAAQGIMLALSILTIRYGNRRANIVLSVFVIIESIRLYVLSQFYAPGPHSYSPIYALLHLSYAIGPLLYFYVRLLVDAGYRLSWRSLLHFIPILLGFLLFLPGGPIIESGAVSYTGFSDMPADRLRSATFGTLPAFISLFVYSLVALQHLRRHSIRIREEFSDIAQINLRWLQVLVWFCLLSAVLSGITECLRGVLLWDLGPRVVISMLLTVLLLYGIGLFGLRQPAIFDQGVRPLRRGDSENGRQPLSEQLAAVAQASAPAAAAPATSMAAASYDTEQQAIADSRGANADDVEKGDDKYLKTGLDEEHVQRLWQSLCQLMHTDKPYLQPGLKLAELAHLIGTRSNYLSQVINSCAQKNFFEYINEHRVQESRQLLLDEPDTSIADVALLVGFGSLSVFNANFKRIIGQTPSQFRKQTN